jgi:hypothetical protein
VDGFYVIKARNSAIYDVVQWQWTQPGSEKVISELLQHRNHWHTLYDQALASLPTPVVIHGFLGAGGFGRVVHVTANVVQSAVKISLVTNAKKESLDLGEFGKLVELQVVPSVVRVRNGSLQHFVINKDITGFCYLLESVGRQANRTDCKNPVFREKMFLSLQSLHFKGYHH